MFSNYSLATRLCDKYHSVQEVSMMSIIGDKASRIIYRLMDEPETTVNEVLRVLEQKLTPELNIRYKRYLFNSTKQEMEETYQEYFMRLMTLVKLCDLKEMEDKLISGIIVETDHSPLISNFINPLTPVLFDVCCVRVAVCARPACPRWAVGFHSNLMSHTSF
ncbi:hypothetical protein J6590_022929 [Homalodisca vitripennis]|nr:hypothetical protein J6590_022929 [Homalodisca vitripennis]